LEQVVLGEIRRLTQFASRYENDFVKAAIGQSQQNIEAEREAMRRVLKDLQKRDAELDNLLVRIYEDNAIWKITDERFSKMSTKYEAEQAEKIDGVHVQKLKIHYNCVGSIKIPNVLPLPQPEVLIQTRKGVALSYSQSQQVVNL
jgi:hypothetical protein